MQTNQTTVEFIEHDIFQIFAIIVKFNNSLGAGNAYKYNYFSSVFESIAETYIYN